MDKLLIIKTQIHHILTFYLNLYVFNVIMLQSSVLGNEWVVSACILFLYTFMRVIVIGLFYHAGIGHIY